MGSQRKNLLTRIRQPSQQKRMISTSEICEKTDNCTQVNDRIYCRSINADEMLKRIDAEVIQNIKELVYILLQLEKNSLLK